MRRHSSPHPLRLILIGIFLVGSTFLAWPARAQFINPSGLPPGGRSASWLDTSSQAQQKLGSLLIGDGARQLCLNGSTGTACVSSWTEAANGVGGPFVRVYQDQILVPEFRQTGYARLIGTANRPTLESDADPVVPPEVAITKTGVYASYIFDQYSFAGSFSGRVRIIADTSGSPGQLCLNTTNLYPDNQFFNGQYHDFGCIDDWTDLQSTSIGPYIKVQAANPPVLQDGAGWLGTDQEYSPGVPAARPGAWQFNSVVVGGVSPNPPVAAFCGDGLCSSELGETAASCLADCQP